MSKQPPTKEIEVNAKAGDVWTKNGVERRVRKVEQPSTQHERIIKFDTDAAPGNWNGEVWWRSWESGATLVRNDPALVETP